LTGCFYRHDNSLETDPPQATPAALVGGRELRLERARGRTGPGSNTLDDVAGESISAYAWNMTIPTTPRQLAAGLLDALRDTSDPLGAAEAALPWLTWMGRSIRSEATGEILLRARDANSDGGIDRLAEAILYWHERLAYGWSPNADRTDPETLDAPLEPATPPPPYESRQARLERANESFAGIPPREEGRIVHIGFRVVEEWRARGSDQSFFRFVANLPAYLEMAGQDPATIEDIDLLEALTRIQTDRDRERWAARGTTGSAPAIPGPPEPVPQAEETIRRLFQVARENAWSESDALMWLTSSSTLFPGPGHRGIYHLDDPGYVAERAEEQFGSW
jgi:hypothetical protein